MAHSLLLKLFPGVKICEEVHVPCSGLYLDLFIPSIPLVVEVHGAQHYKHIPFFHRTKADYLLSLKRDRDKIEWCTLNNIPLVVLPDNKEEEWQNLINSAISQE